MMEVYQINKHEKKIVNSLPILPMDENIPGSAKEVFAGGEGRGQLPKTLYSIVIILALSLSRMPDNACFMLGRK